MGPGKSDRRPPAGRRAKLTPERRAGLRKRLPGWTVPAQAVRQSLLGPARAPTHRSGSPAPVIPQAVSNHPRRIPRATTRRTEGHTLSHLVAAHAEPAGSSIQGVDRSSLRVGSSPGSGRHAFLARAGTYRNPGAGPRVLRPPHAQPEGHRLMARFADMRRHRRGLPWPERACVDHSGVRLFALGKPTESTRIAFSLSTAQPANLT